MIEERLLGFDARERIDELGSLWAVDRREVFLLRGDVATPLSTDTLVWPSVFDTGQGIGLPGPERERLHLAGVPLPAYTGANAGLWEDVASLRRYLSGRGAEAAPCMIIAVSWFSDGSARPGNLGPFPTQTVPATPDPGWQRLGFDVAGWSLLSGLSNCGYLPDEVQSLRTQWGPRLNNNHLFDALEDAWQFRALADVRVAEHAPFSVYGLYLVEELARQP